MSTRESPHAQRPFSRAERTTRAASCCRTPGMPRALGCFELAVFSRVCNYERRHRDVARHALWQLTVGEAMVAEIAAIIRAVDLPVTAYIEAGYGTTPAEVARTVDA